MLSVNDKVATDTGKVGILKRKKAGLAWLLLEDGTTIKQPISNLKPVLKRRPRDPNGHSFLDPNANVPMDPSEIPALLKRAPVPEGTTDSIQIRAEGVFRGQTWQKIERQFPLVSGAKMYLESFSLTQIDGKSAKTSSGCDLWTNYDIKAIMAGKPPKEGLPNILHHYRPAQRDIKMPKPSDTPRTSRPAREGSISGAVSLKEILARMTPPMEPRDARIKLRKGGAGLPASSEGRWEWAAKDVDAVVAFLAGSKSVQTKNKPGKVAKPVAKAAKRQAKAAAGKHPAKPSTAPRAIKQAKAKKVLARHARKIVLEPRYEPADPKPTTKAERAKLAKRIGSRK